MTTDALRGHPGVAFVLIRSTAVGGIVLGANGTCRLADGAAEGTDPLAAFGPNAVEHVRHTDGFANCPDLVVNGTLWLETEEEVAAFEELVGSHAGWAENRATRSSWSAPSFPSPPSPS